VIRPIFTLETGCHQGKYTIEPGMELHDEGKGGDYSPDPARSLHGSVWVTRREISMDLNCQPRPDSEHNRHPVTKKGD